MTLPKGIISRFADCYLGLTALIFVLGGEPFIHGSLEALVEQKPLLQRLALIAFALPALAFWIIRRELQNKTRDPANFFNFRYGREAVWILFLWLSVLWTASAWMRHMTFHSGFDMAIFVQAVWNIFHGPFLYSSIKGGICLLGDHFSPLLAAFALPYAIWPDPRCLLLLQAVSAAGCVFLIRKIALKRLQSETWALVFMIAYALYLPVINSVRFEFHPEVAIMPLWFLAVYMLMKQKTGWASLFLGAALLSKENAALAAFGMGLYATLALKQYRFGFFWMIFSPLYLWVVTHAVIPAISGQEYFYLSGNYEVWAKLGAVAFLKHVVSLPSLFYLIKIFGPVCFLSFLSPPALLLVFPAMVQNLTANNEPVTSIFFQYTALLTPFVFVSAIEGAFKVRQSKTAFYLFLAAAILMSGVSEVYVLKRVWKQRNAQVLATQAFLKKVPNGVSVRTHEFFAAHLAHRRELHIYENHYPREGGSQKAWNAEYVVLDTERLGSQASIDIDDLVLRGYRIIAEDGTLKMLRKESETK